MRDIKKYSAWDIMEELEKNNETKLLNIFKNEGLLYKNHKRKFWMKRFDDEVIPTCQSLSGNLLIEITHRFICGNMKQQPTF